MLDLEKKAQTIFEYVVETRNQLFGVPKIVDLNEEELKAFVEEEFSKYVLNYMVIGQFNRYGEATISLNLKTRAPLESKAKLKELLDVEVNAYLRDIENAMQECKSLVYKFLRMYQEKQKPDPFQ